MSCGINRGCIENAIKDYFRSLESHAPRDADNATVFGAMEAELLRRMGRPQQDADLILTENEISYIAHHSGATDGSGFIHNRVVSGMMDAFDKNNNGRINVREYFQRRREG